MQSACRFDPIEFCAILTFSLQYAVLYSACKEARDSSFLPFVGIPFVSSARIMSSRVLLFGGLKKPSLTSFAKARLTRPPHVVGP